MSVGLLLHWHWDLGVPLLACAAGAYVVGARRAGRWRTARTISWLAGVATLAAALASGVDTRADQLLSVHMVQHAGLWLVAPPLLLGGAPVPLALRVSRTANRAVVARVLRSRALAAVTHPILAWTAFVSVTLGTHLTGIYDLALRHDAMHALEHAAYFWSAILFWLPLAGAAPIPHRLGAVAALGYVASAMPAMVVVGLALGAPAQRYEAYVTRSPALGVPALADQHVGASIMLLTGVGGMTVAAMAGVWALLLREERAQRLKDRRSAVPEVAAR